MNLKDLSDQQGQAFLDLLVLAMYADGHLASAEDSRVREALAAMGLESDYDRTRLFDAAVTRVRQHVQPPDAARAYASTLARPFTTREQRRQVLDSLGELLASDQQVSGKEQGFLSVAKDVLGL